MLSLRIAYLAALSCHAYADGALDLSPEACGGEGQADCAVIESAQEDVVSMLQTQSGSWRERALAEESNGVLFSDVVSFGGASNTGGVVEQPNPKPRQSKSISREGQELSEFEQQWDEQRQQDKAAELGDMHQNLAEVAENARQRALAENEAKFQKAAQARQHRIDEMGASFVGKVFKQAHEEYEDEADADAEFRVANPQAAAMLEKEASNSAAEAEAASKRAKAEQNQALHNMLIAHMVKAEYRKPESVTGRATTDSNDLVADAASMLQLGRTEAAQPITKD